MFVFLFRLRAPAGLQSAVLFLPHRWIRFSLGKAPRFSVSPQRTFPGCNGREKEGEAKAEGQVGENKGKEGMLQL